MTETKPEATETGIWIRTAPVQGKDGLQAGYNVVIDIGGDRSIALTEAQAFEHARVLLRACAMAEHDHAVYNQMLDKMENPEIAFSMVQDVQKDRAPFNPDFNSTAPFVYLPGLSRDEKRTPVIQLRLASPDAPRSWGHDEPVGLWDLDAARMHAFALVEAPQVADLDSAYLRVLRGVIGLEENTARAVVAGLDKYRPASKFGGSEAS